MTRSLLLLMMGAAFCAGAAAAPAAPAPAPAPAPSSARPAATGVAALSAGADAVAGMGEAPGSTGSDGVVMDGDAGPDLALAGRGADSATDAATLRGARFTLKHELAGPFKRPHSLRNNRTSFRMEYEKHFFDNFYTHFDLIETAFWEHDHRARARDASAFTESTVKDAYVQFSKGNTSIKVGRQNLIWGESDAGAITDVISPRNLSELFFISLEESRTSQFMVTLDQFSPVGDWSLFYIPDAQFNRLPEPGTAYHLDPSGGRADIIGGDPDLHEFGLRWKKTFGSSDISLMAARLVDNDYVGRLDGVGADGRARIVNGTQRFTMLGMTFNFVTGSYLFSGEVAKKTPRALIDPLLLQPVRKDGVDTSLRVEYSVGNGGNHAVSLEAVSRRVLDWTPAIYPTARSTDSLVLGWKNTFFNENLSANWLTVYNHTYTSYQHSLFLNYKVNGRVSVSLDAFYLSVKDRRNELAPYRGQNNAVLRMQYQF